MKRGLICLILIILIPLISASDVLVWQGQYYTGTVFNVGVYDFNFSVYDASIEGNICYSNITSLTTGNFGEWKTEQYNVSSSCNNVSKDYYLNININGIDQIPRRRLVVWNSLRKDVNEVSTGGLILHGTLSGLSPLKLQDEINFLKSDGTITSALYNAPRELSSSLPSAFTDSLIHDIIQETNDYGMQECFWDENTRTMQMCINGAYLEKRATTISRSLQIVGNVTNKPVDENFTLCEGADDIDCNSDTTGADLLVEDDIEAIGSIFSQENITAENFNIGGVDRYLSSSGPGNLELVMTTPASSLNIKSGSGSGDSSEVRITAESVYLTGSFIGLYGTPELWGASNIYSTSENAFVVNDDISYEQTFRVDTINQTVFAKSLIVDNKIQGNYYSDDGSAGITNTADYHVCTSWAGSNCNAWCTLRIKNGLIVGCA